MKKIISIFLVLVIILLSIPTNFVFAEEVNNTTTASKIIWQAEAGLFGEEGRDVSGAPEYLGPGTDKVYTAKDADGYYFNTSVVDPAGGLRIIYADGGLTYLSNDQTMMWMSSTTVLNALVPYMQLTMDVRVTPHEDSAAFESVEFWTSASRYSVDWNQMYMNGDIGALMAHNHVAGDGE